MNEWKWNLPGIQSFHHTKKKTSYYIGQNEIFLVDHHNGIFFTSAPIFIFMLL